MTEHWVSQVYQETFKTNNELKFELLISFSLDTYYSITDMTDITEYILHYFFLNP